MILSYENLKNQYVKYFKDKAKCDFILTDVLFAFKEIYKFIDVEKVNNILEIGSGTSILLNELSKKFPKKNFFGLDPHEKGFDDYEQISKKIPKSKNLTLFHDTLIEFKTKTKFDLIFSFNVFEHLENQNNYIKRSNQLLSESGKSLILCPNYDFPYEPHFVIPIIFNKEMTYRIFKKKIINHEKTTGEHGLWDGLNLCSKKTIQKNLKKKGYNFIFDFSIKDRFLDRIDNDQSSYFNKRQGTAAKLAKFAKIFFLDKIIFDIFKIPFPYMKLIINKNEYEK